jgi:hypothetical protein
MKLCRQKNGLVVLALASGLLSTGGRRATAQAGIEIGPVVGYYLTRGSAHANDGPNAPGNFSAPAYGGELTVWSRGRLGVQAQSAVAWSNRQSDSNPGGFTTQEPGHIIIGSVAAMYALDADSLQRVWISAGPGFVGYRGTAFESSGSPTEAAGVLGIGGSRSIYHSLGVTGGISTLLYRYAGILGDIGGPPNMEGMTESGSRGTRFRSDVLIHVSITLNGHS